MKKNILLLLVLSLVFFSINAQEEEYTTHKIKSGESLYALTKKYKVTLKEIKDANPDLGAKIDIGTAVRIPKKGGAKKKAAATPVKEKEAVKAPLETSKEVPVIDENNFIKHKLKSKESFAVLSRKYEVSIADIKKANPKLGNSVRVGTIIHIPAKEISTAEQTAQEAVVEEKPAPEPVTQEAENSEEAFIFHKVKTKETLSTISKKYKKTLTQIKKANPSIGSKGLKIGQLVKIPTGKKAAPQAVVAEEADIPSLPNSMGEITHKVKRNQTLFSIAKEYKVSVNDIKKWNNLTAANSLKLGQDLVIKTREDITPEPKKVTPVVVENKEIAPQKEVVTTPSPVKITKPQTAGNTEPDEPVTAESTVPVIALKEPQAQPETDLNKVKVTTSTAVNASGYSKITETGLAELMGETVESNKFLALHKTAPIGTLIQVKNPMTDVAIFVRIIGKLPDNSANDKIIIKVTKKVRERIGALNNRFPVEISYIP